MDFVIVLAVLLALAVGYVLLSRPRKGHRNVDAQHVADVRRTESAEKDIGMTADGLQPRPEDHQSGGDLAP